MQIGSNQRQPLPVIASARARQKLALEPHKQSPGARPPSAEGPKQESLAPKAQAPLLGGLAAPKSAAPDPTKPRPIHLIDPKYRPYLSEFEERAREYGIDTTEIWRHDIIIQDMPKYRRPLSRTVNTNEGNNLNEDDLSTQRLAESFLRDRDGIVIYINPDKFFDPGRSELGRIYNFFHEMGHDLLNFAHTKHVGGLVGAPGWKVDGPLMMKPTSWGSFFSDSTPEEKQRDFVERNIRGLFEHYLYGESDEVEATIAEHCAKWTFEYLLTYHGLYSRTPYSDEDLERIRQTYYPDTSVEDLEALKVEIPKIVEARRKRNAERAAEREAAAKAEAQKAAQAKAAAAAAARLQAAINPTPENIPTLEMQ